MTDAITTGRGETLDAYNYTGVADEFRTGKGGFVMVIDVACATCGRESSTQVAHRHSTNVLHVTVERAG
ncbi:hypothetical protein ACIGKQ_21185 [Gordonia sp. NPDC062954]|uniref:hypothetical protein n=1 Tax=Gordonia sp. NPDC062954 TaxID=3364003 RepID=UPI0037C9A276